MVPLTTWQRIKSYARRQVVVSSGSCFTLCLVFLLSSEIQVRLEKRGLPTLNRITDMGIWTGCERTRNTAPVIIKVILSVSYQGLSAHHQYLLVTCPSKIRVNPSFTVAMPFIIPSQANTFASGNLYSRLK
jgi:hypothetical protein